MATKIVISEHPPYLLDLDAPTLGAREVEEKGVKVSLVWCKYCASWHLHGAGQGHRIAHCRQRSPYTITGYNLVLSDCED
jgi:hypothetical protein